MKRILLLLLSELFLLPLATNAQIQIGTIRGAVVDENEAAIPNAAVRLTNIVSGFESVAATDQKGEFVFNNLPLANYALNVAANGFAAENLQAAVRSNVPFVARVKLRVAATNAAVEITANGGLVDRLSSSTETRIDQSRIERTANTLRGNGLQRLVATVAGAATQNNGLIHIRGVDAVSAGAFDTDDIRSFNAITGNFPAKFGGRNGTVIQIQPKSGINERLLGGFSTNHSNFRTNKAAGSFGGSFTKKFGIYTSGAWSRSSRYLDPVDERSFNNRGRRLNFNLRADWQPGEKDIFIFNLGINGADFPVF